MSIEPPTHVPGRAAGALLLWVMWRHFSRLISTFLQNRDLCMQMAVDSVVRIAMAKGNVTMWSCVVMCGQVSKAKMVTMCQELKPRAATSPFVSLLCAWTP